MPDEAHRHALIRHRAIVGFRDAVADAGAVARLSFVGGRYAIRQVMDGPVDPGFFPHVGGQISPPPQADHSSGGDPVP